jgi:hypothetical protein
MQISIIVQILANTELTFGLGQFDKLPANNAGLGLIQRAVANNQTCHAETRNGQIRQQVRELLKELDVAEH